MLAADLIAHVSAELSRIDGVVAVVLGGSRARGDAHPDSDIDLGIYYEPAHPPALADLRALAARLDDRGSGDVITNFGEWGPWINGGGWLDIQGQRVDWLYRDYALVKQVIEECRAGNARVFYQAGHPHGFWTPIYMGEVHICKPLADPQGALADLKTLTDPYPPALRKAMVERNLWESQFAIDTTRKAVGRGDVMYVTGGLFRCAACLVQVIFALNERYCLNEKGALKLAASFPLCPPEFEATIKRALGQLGDNPAALKESIAQLERLVDAVRLLS
ncbi:MAG: nucleotidyltransferase domain-containing protein [Anaerolineae bacterium]|nr:nucleotidyltransferase domain-containing protein [Anaerolineae bacterium]